jgi:hypothetical protein
MLMTFAGVRFDLSQEWCDITEDLDPGAPPTLARDDGVGVIQFSVAKYKSGTKPSVSQTDLKEMLSEFLKSKRLIGIEPSVLEGSRCCAVGGISATPEEVIGAWYVSNGTDVALVSYTCTANDPIYKEELAEAGNAVRTLEFV